MNTTILDRAEFTSGGVRSSKPSMELVQNGLAARLLSRSATDPASARARLAWGLLGLGALGTVPDLALYAADAARSEEFSSIALVLLRALSFPAAAALTLTFALPGLFILLGMQAERPAPGAMLQALSRAYYRVGLLSLGVTPALTLFALTGASQDGITLSVTASYFLAGAAGVAILLYDFYQALDRKRMASAGLLFGWGCFVAVLGIYFFVKLHP